MASWHIIFLSSVPPRNIKLKNLYLYFRRKNILSPLLFYLIFFFKYQIWIIMSVFIHSLRIESVCQNNTLCIKSTNTFWECWIIWPWGKISINYATGLQWRNFLFNISWNTQFDSKRRPRVGSHTQGSPDRQNATGSDIFQGTCTSDYFTNNFSNNHGLKSNSSSAKHYLGSTSPDLLFLSET